MWTQTLFELTLQDEAVFLRLAFLHSSFFITSIQPRFLRMVLISIHLGLGVLVHAIVTTSLITCILLQLLAGIVDKHLADSSTSSSCSWLERGDPPI